MSDDRYLDELGERAARAVRDRARDVARRTPEPGWLTDASPRRPPLRVWSIGAAAAAGIAALAVVATTLLQPPPGSPVVGPVPDATTAIDHRELQRQWIDEVCVPATGDTAFCERMAGSEAWPWHSDDPLASLEARYRDPTSCAGQAMSDGGVAACEALGDHYRENPSHPTPTPPGSEEPVPSLLDSGTQDAWYMTAEGYHGQIDGRHDDVCTWVRTRLPDEDFPAHVNSEAYRRLHELINRELTFKSDGLPSAVGAVCGLLDAYPPDVVLDGYEPVWWDDPPYPWQQQGRDALEDVPDTLRALSTDTLADGSAAYTDRERFQEHADRSGGVANVCRWLQARVPSESLPRGGRDWDTNGEMVRRAVAQRHPGDGGLNEVLVFVCGYLDPSAASSPGGEATDRWWLGSSYPWGVWRPVYHRSMP